MHFQLTTAEEIELLNLVNESRVPFHCAIHKWSIANFIVLFYYESYAPTLFKTWSWIIITSGLNIRKMVKKTEL